MPRKKIIAANWKMYKTPTEAREFVHAFLPLVAGHDRDEIVLCPPFVDLAVVTHHLRGSNVKLGAQDVFWESEGAYTGATSAPMLKAAGCTHVILGHSERRQYFGESDDTVNKKLLAALKHGLAPIVCIGELLAEREAGLTDEILRRQCHGAFREVANDAAQRIAIAYEPVWAIGTGKTATPELAAAAHMTIRAELENIFGNDVAQGTRILYGGSVKPENAKALMGQEEIDGALVGGASLDAKSFAAIIHY
jgi:triosephosphate isomerase (TIM)